MKKPIVPGSFAARGRTLSRKFTFFEEATCPGQLRCLGQNFSQKIDFVRRSHLSRAASLPGAELFPENLLCLKKPLVLGSFAAWGRCFFSENRSFFEEATCPGQLRCLGQNFLKIPTFLFEQATCPGQLRCLGQNFCRKSICFYKNPLVPGSFAKLPGAELLAEN